MFIIYIMREITEAKIRNLIKERDEAIVNRKYKKAWKLNMEIDKRVNRMTSLCYCEF